MAKPRAPQQGSSAMGLGHRRSRIHKGSSSRPPLGQWTPCSVPRQPLSTMFFDVSTCLEGQTTSESYETRTVVSISKIASQWFKSRVDFKMGSAECRGKVKDARRKRRNDDAWPSPEPPNRGARLWGSAIDDPVFTKGRVADPPWGSGPPAVSPVSPFRRRFSTFLHVWKVKRPRNPTKQGPLCPYRR